jgi:hypothetical protein
VWIALLAVAVPALLVTSANAGEPKQSGTWTDGTGSWGTDTNWSGKDIANGENFTATFNLNMGADLTVTLDKHQQRRDDQPEAGWRRRTKEGRHRHADPERRQHLLWRDQRQRWQTAGE